MSFQLVSKSVTLNDTERRNGPYILRNFIDFHVRCRRKTIISPTSGSESTFDIL